MKTIKKSLLSGALASVLLALAACASTDTGSTATTARGVKPYTSDMCITTDNKLGSMGDPVTMVYEGQEVKFCCQPCVAKFKANPQKYLSNL
jgi:hypothetical protein